MSSALALGNQAFVDEEFEEAVKRYTESIDEDPSAQALVNRCCAMMKLERYEEASEDAKEALQLEPSNTKAAFRLGVAYFELENFVEAGVAFQTALSTPEGAASAKKLKMWIRKCNAELELTTPGAKPAAKPAAAKPAAAPAKPVAAAAPAVKKAAPAVSDSKIRHEWYQNPTHVMVTVFAKGVAKEDATLDLNSSSLELTIKIGSSGSEYQLALDLFGEVDTEASTMSIMKTKVELKLKKKSEGNWEGLEKSTGMAVLSAMTDDGNRPSAYSSKRDWDSIDGAAKKEIEEDKPEGEAALNKLFQDIYGNADEDTRRAMIKSFQTSGGTVLSTNWGEVGTKDYEAEGIKGPDGMEWRKHGA